MNKKVVWILVFFVVSGLAYPKLKPLIGGVDSNGKTKPSAAGKPGSAGKNSGGQQSRALRVSTFTVESTTFIEKISATGTVRADESVELQAETNGKIVSINFVEGGVVKRGELLVKINDADLQANMERYRYSKQLAEVRFRRYVKLQQQQMVTQDEYDASLSEVNVQQSFIDLYQAQIQETEIRAPFDGVVGLRYVSVGSYVNANTTIATLQGLNQLKIDFSVPEKYSGRIALGSGIEFSVAGGLKKYTAQIYAIDPRIDSATRTMLVRAVARYNDGSLLPGASAVVSVQLEPYPNALFIPAEAVISGLEEKIVYVLKDGVALQRAVQIGSRTATQVHIVAGLDAGDTVITSGLQQMKNGQAVESLREQSGITKKGSDIAKPRVQDQANGSLKSVDVASATGEKS